MATTKPSDEIDLESRRLCPDGACIGVIGPDGRCKVCGRLDDGAPQQSAAEIPPDEVEEAAAEAADEAPDEGPDDRQLCPDEACIGLLGPDGRCKVCGKSASS